MAQRWNRRVAAEEQAGPYQFFPTHRRCSACKELLLSQEQATFGAGLPVQNLLGMPCYCMACNTHYRALPSRWMRWMPWRFVAVLMPGLARWLWWKSVRVKKIFTYQEGFFDGRGS